MQTPAYAVHAPTDKLAPFSIDRREVGPNDVLIDILFCGVCHSDIHQARGEWGNSIYPMVPGHEIVGRIAQIGAQVSKFQVGDLAGVGCFVDSCRTCSNCDEGLEQYCENHLAVTYNGTFEDGTPTFGGYSTQIVVDEKYTLSVSPDLPLQNVAPLLCAGITTYSPLRHFNVRQGMKVGVIGLGGLGHMAVKFAVSMGADVTVFSTSPGKEADAKALGAQHFVVTRDPKNLESLANSFELIVDAVSAQHDVNMYLNLLKRDGALALVGAPDKPLEVGAFNVIVNRRTLIGSAIGGIAETQEMLDYCAEKNITCDVEMIDIKDIEAAFERTIKGDVRYRFVIDMQSLKNAAE